MKRRSQEEIAEIVKCFLAQESMHEISKKFGIGDEAIYRIIQKYNGKQNPKRVSKEKKLEKKLAQAEKEIELLRAALKKL